MIRLLLEVMFVHTVRVVLAIAGVALLALAGFGVTAGRASFALLGAASLALAAELPLIAS